MKALQFANSYVEYKSKTKNLNFDIEVRKILPCNEKGCFDDYVEVAFIHIGGTDDEAAIAIDNNNNWYYMDSFDYVTSDRAVLCTYDEADEFVDSME
jgi:hypothetical protein